MASNVKIIWGGNGLPSLTPGDRSRCEDSPGRTVVLGAGPVITDDKGVLWLQTNHGATIVGHLERLAMPAQTELTTS